MLTIKKDEIPRELGMFPVILYGAGFAGKQCKKILEEENIEISYFVDDDKTKWGKCIEGLIVCSYEGLCEYCKGKDHINIILTSIYGVQISKRLANISNITVYEMYDWYTERVMPERYGGKIYGDESLKKYQENIYNLKKYLADDKSYNIFQNLYQYMISGNIEYIAEICTKEEQYFIEEVMSYLGDKEISIVDGGAYEGELIRAIHEKNINVKEWYCFETNSENFQQLVKNSHENGFGGKQVCVNKGLWNISTSLYVEGSGTSSKIVEKKDEVNLVETITIDEFFKDIKVDLIKMDIEGAETNAIKGGMNVIKRDRPVLAISIYHSIEDYYNIMNILRNELQDYMYYVRHHSMVFCETVLYAIPKNESV